MSYPVAFVVGGVSLYLAWELWRGGCRRGWAAWWAFNAVVLASFLTLFALSARNQSSSTLYFMQICWADGFPPLGDPLRLIRWLFDVHTGALMAYPLGGNHYGSVLTFLGFVVGAATLLRRRQMPLLLLLLAPLGLSLIAAAIHRYPYGQMVKFQIYAAPAFCVLSGIGYAAILARFGAARSPVGAPIAPIAPIATECPVPGAPRPPIAWRLERRFCAIAVVLTLLAMVGISSIARDFWFPAKSTAVMRARDFARWFWFTAAFDSDVVCMKTDLHRVFAPETFQRGLSAMYLCNQRIYSPRHASGRFLSLEELAANRPLRCVEYRSPAHPYDHEAQAAWMAEMKTRYVLAGEDDCAFILGERKGQPPCELDYVHIYRFVPKAASVSQKNP
jgi:hypothetical protein